MRKRFIIFLTIAAFLLTSVYADEGEWLLKDIAKLDLQSKGLKISPDEIFKPGKQSLNSAICQVGGGTGEFVSDKGLILTNHHVAYTAVQRSSTDMANLIKDGFIADSMDKEIAARGYEARVTIDYTDVSDIFLDAVKDIKNPVERTKALEKVSKELVAKAEKDNPDYRYEISTTFGGTQFYLFKYFVAKDIRIVYVPPVAIGEFGGEIDNWMWPRHTGDFSYLRAYVSKEGKGVEYSKDNVPYKPAKHLSIAKEGLAKDDFVFVIGYPGQTVRYRTSYSIDYFQNIFYPRFINKISEIKGIIDKYSEKDQAAAIKLASLNQGLENAYKNFQGNLEGMKKVNLLDKKVQIEKQIAESLASNPAELKEYEDVMKKIKGIYEKNEKHSAKEFSITGLNISSSILGDARLIYKYSLEKEKPDLERDAGFQERNVPILKRRLMMTEYGLYVPAQIEMLSNVLKEIMILPEENRIEAINNMFMGKTGDELNKAIEEYVQKAYAETKLLDTKTKLELFGKDTKTLLATNDPFIKLAAELESTIEADNEWNREFAGVLSEIRPKFIAFLAKWKGGDIYPDANGTVRFSYGYVKGYKPKDAVVYDPFTTLAGVIEKDTGKSPFDVPEKLTTLEKTKNFGSYAEPALNNDVPVAFLSTLDSTGGNSGSPVLNAKGEMVGILFDGNYESMISDFVYDPELTRAISVDIRYVLFITEKFTGADFILKEMGLK